MSREDRGLEQMVPPLEERDLDLLRTLLCDVKDLRLMVATLFDTPGKPGEIDVKLVLKARKRESDG